jgi:hypothetical protein
LTSQNDNILSLKKSILTLTHEYPITKQTNIETYLSTSFDCPVSKKRKIDTIDLKQDTISENKEEKFLSSSEKEKIVRKNFEIVSLIMQPPQKKQKSDISDEMNFTNCNEKNQSVHRQTLTTPLQTNQSLEEITPILLSYPSHSTQNSEQLREYEMKKRFLERQENEIKEKLLVEGPNCAVLYETFVDSISEYI